MGKIILICGKIASGKSYYANQMKTKEKAIILSTDELTYAMFDNEQGDKYEQLAHRANNYLLKKAIELAQLDCNVILDWGFWQKRDRKVISDYLKAKHIDIQWHYIQIDDESWEKNISVRNQRIEQGIQDSSFYVTEGLKNKLLSKWEEPSTDEIDVWYQLRRT